MKKIVFIVTLYLGPKSIAKYQGASDLWIAFNYILYESRKFGSLNIKLRYVYWQDNNGVIHLSHPKSLSA